MAVLVTGGGGFIGSSVAEQLIRMGREVVCVDDFNDYYNPQVKWRNISALIPDPRFHVEVVSITDAAALGAIFARYSIHEVIHLAARAGVRPSLRQPVLYEQVNVQGTLHLLELSRQYGIRRFLFGSSSSVYGMSARVPFREDDPADRPISPYAATKRAGELLCHTYHHLYGLPVVCLRLFTVYGPRQRPDLAIHRFTRALYEGREITMFGDGSSARDYTYITDIVAAIIAALDIEPPPGYEIINLGSSTPIMLRDLIHLLERVLGRQARIRREPAQPGDVPLTYAGIEKAETLLGWHPRVSIEEGIENFVAWFLEERKASEGNEVVGCG
jgi:UDP-glucuronate 4-epimerase